MTDISRRKNKIHTDSLIGGNYYTEKGRDGSQTLKRKKGREGGLQKVRH